MVTTVKNEHGHPATEIDGAGLLLIHVKPVHDALPHTHTRRLPLRLATTPPEDTNANVQQARTHLALLMGRAVGMRLPHRHAWSVRTFDALLDLGRPPTKKQPSLR